MRRELDFLGEALLVVLVLSVAWPSDAPAKGSYTAYDYPTTGTAESLYGNDTITTEAGVVKCDTIEFEGTLSAASSSLTVKANYYECSSVFPTATISMGSCDYLFKTPTGSGHNWSAPISIQCAKATEPIRVVTGTCEYTIGNQSPGGGVSLKNQTIFGLVDIKINMTGIGYTVTKDGFGCPFAGTGPRTGATYAQHYAQPFSATNGGYIDVG